MATITKSGSQISLKSSDYAVICCDSQDTVISWDVQAEHLFSWKHSEALGKKIFDLILPPASELNGTLQFQKLFKQYRKETSVTLKINENAADKDGKVFPAEFVVSPLPGGDFFTIFIRNIEKYQEQIEAEASKTFKLEVINTILKISLEPTLLKERLSKILEYVLSIDELDLLEKAALFLVEQDTKKLALTVQHGLNREEREQCGKVPFGHCYCGKAALSNKLRFVSSKSARHPDQRAVQSPHGHYCVPISTHGIVTGVICLYTPENHQQSKQNEEILGAAAHVIAAIIDHQKMDLQLVNLVNDLRASILALREEKSFSESVIQGLEHGLIVTDNQGNIQKCNDVAKIILSPFTSQLEGHNLSYIIGHSNARKVLTEPTGVIGKEENEITLSPENGEEIILRYSSVKRSDSKGGDEGTIVSLTDVSEWRYVRKEMEKMNRLSTVAEIASAVAHEVRNPLAGIKIMAQSIEEGSGTEEERIECSQRIIRQVDRLNELLTDFFSYARPVVPKKQECSLESILAEIKPLIVNKLMKQRIELVESFADDLPPVIADPNQVQQVFLNLFLNAIDAIKQEGEIEVVARSVSPQKLAQYRKTNHLLRKGTKYISVEFTDNGAGMPPEAAEKVFEPFYTTKTNGSGLGMSIVYRTLKENDAAISVQSTEGKGTTFHMFFKSV